MSGRSAISGFRKNASGSTMAEFALVLPVALLFLLGLIDAGRYLYTVNQGIKAAQIGARWSAATDFLPTSLVSYSFVLSGGLTQGDPVNATAFPGADCSGDDSTLTCACPAGGTCPYLGTTNHAAFMLTVNRMKQFMPSLASTNVEVKYTNSGLGYAGDPSGADVAPFVTVRIHDVTFSPFILFGSTPFTLPDFTQTLTMEDGQGTGSN